MIDAVARYVGGKVLGATLVASCAIVVIWYWRLPPEAREGLWAVARGALIWIGFVGVLPWALFFLPPVIVRAESNLVSALALLGYLAMDIGCAMYLTGGGVAGRWQGAVLAVGFLVAGVYNFVVCEFLAVRAEDTA